MEAFSDFFTTEHNLRYDSLESKCSSDKIVNLEKWLSSTSFKYKRNESSLCKDKIKFEWLKDIIRIYEESTNEQRTQRIGVNYQPYWIKQ